jgi:D-alanyl-D-alanine carboxypeptidase/D-alanyl-D-alanine-endopeptidase (penicillin-binding protein 4)
MRRKEPFLTPLLVLIFAVSISGCAAKTTVRAGSALPAHDSRARLRTDLDHIFDDPNFAAAQWGVEVLSLESGETLYERNPYRLYLPASNNKVLTSVAALLRLGPDFRFETAISTDGAVADGVLRGNLIVIGSGDPGLAPRFHSGDAFAVFKNWARQLKEKGIRKIEGDIIGDDRAFPEPWLGASWEWGDLAYGYAAPVSALQFNENLVTAEIAPAAKEGDPASINILPISDYMSFDFRVVTGARGSAESMEVDRTESGESVVIRGTVPLGGETITQTIAVRYPTLFYLHALKQTFQSEGIGVAQCNLKRGQVPTDAGRGLTMLWTHSSPPLAEILKPLLKVSQNLYAETLTRALGLSISQQGTFEKGREIVEDTLRGMAIEKGTYNYADGSGLSRRNLISADLLVRIFKFMYRHKYFAQFYEALPIAGVDGTITSRMKGTRAENNVHAKTGTITSVRSLSGYIRTADGEMLAFSMIANNFLASGASAGYVQDSAAVRLANFSRGK